MGSTTTRPEAHATDQTKRALERERYRLAVRIGKAQATPMTVLSFVWLTLLVLDFTRGLSPLLTRLNYVIWGVFVLQFLVEFVLTPHKLAYFRRNWLTAVALLLPAARVLRAFRAVRAVGALRGARLVGVVSRANRGMRALGSVMGRRGFGYVAALTVLVTVGGAAGMYAFEHGVPGSDMDSFGSALWWTAMLLTTMGSDYFPKTPEGRLLCLLLATYGFAIFGYVTATVASYFVARDADTDEGEIAGAKQLDALRSEIEALRRAVEGLSSSGRAP